MGYLRPEPLRVKHGCDGFNSGEESLDLWLTRHARHAEAAGSARTLVTCPAGETKVAGYYALTVGEVHPDDATERLLKGQPRGASVPVVILARLAVDEPHQRKGVGRSLLQDALLRSLEAGELVGVRAVVVNAISPESRDWYFRYGFEPSPTDPLHLILLMNDLRKLLDVSEGR